MITITISRKQFDFYLEKARAKIKIENWEGRNQEVKARNFACSFATENEFAKILKKANKKFKARGYNYVGDVENAPEDIVSWVGGEKEIDIKSIKIELLQSFNNMCYPCDQFYNNQIPDFLVFASIDIRPDVVYINYLGFYTKKELVEKINKESKKLYSKKNQEWFFALDYPKEEVNKFIQLLDNET